MRVFCVSMVSAADSSENEQRKHKMKWRGRRDAPTVKKKKVIGRQIWISFSLGYSGFECCVSFGYKRSCAKTVLSQSQNEGINENYIMINQDH